MQLNQKIAMKRLLGILTRSILLLALTRYAPPSALGQTALFSEDFETDTSAEWEVFEGSGNGIADFTSEFGFDYSVHQIPPAPNSSGATSRGLKFTVNNNDDEAATSAVSAYPKGKMFSGNFALRFDMWIHYNGPAFGGTGSTEFGIFGINHTGDKVNWADSPDSDGVWFAVTGEGGASRDYRSYDGITGSPGLELQDVDGGFLDRNGDGATEFNVSSGQTDDFPLKALFPVPPFETPGAPGKQWVQGEVRQIDNEATWLLDGYVIARRLNLSEFGSGNVMIGYMDIFTSIANPREENFIIYDNVRVVDLTAGPAISEISIEGTDTEAAEPGTNTAAFSVARTGPTTASLTVPFRFSGSATPGVDFSTNNLPVVIPAGSSATTVTITPLDDLIGEPTETIVIVPLGGSDFDVVDAFRATVELLDDGDVTSVTVETQDAHIYERIVEDTGSFSIVRLGDTSGELTVNLTFEGTAQPERDYTGATTSVVIPAGETTASLTIEPIDDGDVEGDETIVIRVAAGPEYGAGVLSAATITIKDDDLPEAMSLFADDFDADSSAQWAVLFGAANEIPDFTAEFAYDYGFDGIDPSPRSTGGTTRGLRLAVNKDDPTGSGAAGVNLYPLAQTFQGNFALRFEMFLNFGTDVGGSTEHTMFGINHSGSLTNRHGTAGSDGLWFAVETDGSASGGGRSYVAYRGAGASAPPTFQARPASDFATVFSSPLYPAPGASSGQWVDVEVAQVGNEVTLRINGSEISRQINDSDFKSGNIMLGHMDTFNSIGSLDNFVIFDNVQVVSLPDSEPAITIFGIALLSNDRVRITFGATGGEESGFRLLGSDSVQGPYVEETGVDVQAGAVADELQFTTTLSALGSRFFRIAF